jgi:putative endonuclease
MKHHLDLGIQGESMAVRYLIQKGYKILERNWRYSRAEIDIIAQQNSILVFCEVKARSTSLFGEPEVFVDQKKIRLMVDAATVYMDTHHFKGEIRFDIIAIIIKNREEYSLKHIEDAFFPGIEGFM